MKVHTLEEYAELLEYPKNATLKRIQEGEDVSDYPLEELQYCIDENKNVVVVQVAENEYRLCEV